MPTTCQINFHNNPQKIVFAGQKLHITVRLKLTEEVKVRGIHIHLCGTAHVRFFANRYYTADEDVLDMRKCLTGENGETEVLPIGTHDFNFTSTLPHDLPSSFSGKYGYIKYSANVILRIPLWPDRKFDEPFTYFRRVNLNYYPSLKAEVSDQKVQTISPYVDSGYTVQGTIVSISARMPFAGYALGQSINLQVSVNNTTNCPIYNFIVYILRKTTYLKSANSEQRKIEYTVVQKRSVANWTCGKQTYKTFPILNIKIPPVIATDMETCQIIKNEYLVSIKGVARDVKESQIVAISLDLPITIGTIPLDDTLTMAILPRRTRFLPIAPPLLEPSAPVFPEDDTVSIRTYTSTPPPFPNDDAGLPTYEEAMLINQQTDVTVQDIGQQFAQLCVNLTNNQPTTNNGKPK